MGSSPSRSGFLDAKRTLPLSLLERQACYYTFSEPAAICQNMLLATEAMGLGGWKHCGFLSLEVLELMGFRLVASGPDGFGNPIGLDGVFEARCPPCYASMDDAVDSVLTPQSRENRPSGTAPHLMPDTEHRTKATEAATAAPRRIAGAPTHGYEATREAAMSAFAKSWRRERSACATFARPAHFDNAFWCVHLQGAIVSYG